MLDGAPFGMTGHKQQPPELLGVKPPQSLSLRKPRFIEHPIVENLFDESSKNTYIAVNLRKKKKKKKKRGRNEVHPQTFQAAPSLRRNSIPKAQK